MKIDARGLVCPQPVLMTKNGLAKSPEGVEVMVDNETSKENVSRYAVNNGYQVSVDELDGGEYTIVISK